MISKITFLICDVIWENTAYGGTNGVFLDQAVLYIFIQTFSNCAESEKDFSAYAHVIKSSSLTRRRTFCVASDQSLFFLSLDKLGFPR